MAYQTDLSVKIGDLSLKNPILPASGAYDYFENNAGVFPMCELGAVMVKSVHRLVRPGNPAPRITEVTGGMINAVGIPSIGIEAFMDHELTHYTTLGAPVVLSISGNAPEHYRESLEIVNDDKRIAAVELNFSCPNVGTGLPFSSDPGLLKTTLAAARKATRLPLFVKLSPNVADIRPGVKVCEALGADAVTLSNTWRAMQIDIYKRRPVLGNISGGMSGPAVKPVAVRMVHQVAKAVSIPVVGLGGIMTAEDAIEFLMAGATAIEVGTANFIDPAVSGKIADGIGQWLDRHEVKDIHEIIGAVQ